MGKLAWTAERFWQDMDIGLKVGRIAYTNGYPMAMITKHALSAGKRG